MKLWQDLTRRRVFRLIGLYIVGAWLVMQVAATFFPAWGIPESALRYVLVAAVLCFPVAVVFSWFYDVTSDGIVRTSSAGDAADFDYRLKRKDYLVLAALAGISVTVIYASIDKVRESAPDFVPTPTVASNSIAVLPFSNFDSDLNTQYFSNGVTEEILHRLSEFDALRVLARTSSFAFANSELTVPRITEILGVRYLLQGSVRRDQDQVRVSAQLVDNSGIQVWSQTFDRKLEGIFAIQGEIANAVARQLVDRIAPQTVSDARTTTSIDAYQDYLVGREFLYSRSPGWEINASAAFQRAIELDPEFAPPYAGLAVATHLGPLTTLSAMREKTAEARVYAEKALTMEPNLAEAHAALGLLFMDEMNAKPLAAEASLRRAIEIDPSVTNAYNWLSNALAIQGKFDEAHQVKLQGLKVDPLNPILNVNLAAFYIDSGDFDRAETLLLRLLELPSPPELAYRSLVGLYTQCGRFRDALRYWTLAESASAGLIDSVFHYESAHFFQALGLRKQADAQFERGKEMDGIAVRPIILWGRMLGAYGEFEELRNHLDAAHGKNLFDEDRLPPVARERLAILRIISGDYGSGIALAENLVSDEKIAEWSAAITLASIDLVHALAYGYRMTGQDLRADELLDYLRRVFETRDLAGRARSPELLEQKALNLALRGQVQEASQVLSNAVDAGWRNYLIVRHDPRWKELLEFPALAPVLSYVSADIDKQAAEISAGFAGQNH